jgi:hypothetical protein
MMQNNDLNASPSETLKMADVGSPSRPLLGLVAILDALGAATYSREDSERFLESRDLVMEATHDLVESSLKRFDEDRLKRFTFNDTVVLAYLLDDLKAQAIRDVETFCHVLRTFETLSIGKGILFRGSLAIGEFYRISEKAGTIMGPAVSDAAAWYGLADWIGINATPHATLFIDWLLEHQASVSLDHLLVDYEVPLKDKRKLRLKAVNWPKGFYVRGLQPEEFGRTPKAQLLRLLAEHRVPRDSESKYFNTIDFFDYVERGQHLLERFSGVKLSAEAPRTS